MKIEGYTFDIGLKTRFFKIPPGSLVLYTLEDYGRGKYYVDVVSIVTCKGNRVATKTFNKAKGYIGSYIANQFYWKYIREVANLELVEKSEDFAPFDFLKKYLTLN